LFRKSTVEKAETKIQLFGSGTILNKVVEAQQILAEKYGIAADVWSVTSYKELHRDAIDTERWNMLHPGEKPRLPYVAETLQGVSGPFVAASDYVRALPESVGKWIPGAMLSLGTDGFGRSDGRRHLREFFEVDQNYIAFAALTMLLREGRIKKEVVLKAMQDLGINPDKANPMVS